MEALTTKPALVADHLVLRPATEKARSAAGRNGLLEKTELRVPAYLRRRRARNPRPQKARRMAEEDSGSGTAVKTTSPIPV